MPKSKLSIFLLLIAGILFLWSCALEKKEGHGVEKPPADEPGLLLAQQYCSGCHAFPKAEILPTTYWGRLMPIMGFFLGAGKEKYQFADYLDPIAKERLSKSGLFPEESMLEVQDWIAINKYYLNYSPKELSVDNTPGFSMDLPQFTVEALPWKNTHDGVSYLSFAEGHYEIGSYTEEASYFVKVDQQGKEIERTRVSSPLTAMRSSEVGEQMLLMGTLDNIDVPTGKLIEKHNTSKELIASLERPIDFEVADFNNDGVDDFLVAEFGKFLGGINIYTQIDSLQKINLYPQSGALQIILKDVNQDGLQDFYVLVAQADECVYLFLNQGDFNFDRKRLFRLPAHYGTTHFELADFDGDGDEDIVCSSGDSGDYGIILKPFHGVRIFENKGKDQYDLAWFFPQQGAYGTAAADYDNDGDVDFASIGYFAAHLERDRELFIYFENTSTRENKWQFNPNGFRGEEGDCWIRINKADVDQDGDIDILLGANSKVLHPESKVAKLQQWQTQGGMITVLKNNLNN